MAIGDTNNPVPAKTPPEVAAPSISAEPQNASVKVALDITKEWEKVCGENKTLVQGCIIVRAEFAEQHPDVVEAFLEKYKASIEKITADPDASAEAMVESGILPSKEIALKAIPGCNICYIEGQAMEDALINLFEALYSVEPKSVGGKIPGSDICYYKAK